MSIKKKIYWIVLGVIISVLLLVTLVLVFQKKEDRPFNRFDFPETVNVTNGTCYDNLDTIALVLANKIFKIDTLDLKIYYTPNILNKHNMEFYAIVQKLPFGEHQYVILLNKDINLVIVKLILSHEFVHIEQYEQGHLKVFKNFYIWKGETVFFEDTEYLNRPYEIEAFRNQNNIRRELNKLLYE